MAQGYSQAVFDNTASKLDVEQELARMSRRLQLLENSNTQLLGQMASLAQRKIAAENAADDVHAELVLTQREYSSNLQELQQENARLMEQLRMQRQEQTALVEGYKRDLSYYRRENEALRRAFGNQ